MTWRRWTSVEDDRLRSVYGRVPVSDLASQLNRTPASVMNRAGVLGLRKPHKRTHCPHGHEYTEENTRIEMIRGRPAQVCKTCSRHSGTRAFQFGLTLADVETVLKVQDNRCLICLREFVMEDRRRRPNYDHDHETGERRGFICEDCNIGLGRFHDDADVLLRAAEWVRPVLHPVWRAS
jgi:hypothetical protein